MLKNHLKSCLHRVIDNEDLWEKLITTIYEGTALKDSYLSCTGIFSIFM